MPVRALVKFAALLAIAATPVFAMTTAPAAAQELKLTDRTISISATGHAYAEPDIASINTGVITEAEIAKDALAANTEAMTKVIETLKAAGLESRDIQTTDFSIQPKYQYNQDNSPPKLVGYTVSNQVSIRVRDLKKLGAILDAVVQSGSNQINGIQFDVSSAPALRDTARKQAVENARKLAALYAEAAGVKLGPILKIEETTSIVGPQVNYRVQAASADSAPVPIAGGQQAIEAQVNIVWALQ